MKTFPELIKNIRTEANLTQKDFAKKLEVSPVLIAMVETGQKEVSKRFVLKLAELLEVHPASITPFLYFDNNKREVTGIEQKLLNLGEKIQTDLIKNRSKLIRND